MSLLSIPEVERLTLTHRITGKYCGKNAGQCNKNGFFC